MLMGRDEIPAAKSAFQAYLLLRRHGFVTSFSVMDHAAMFTLSDAETDAWEDAGIVVT